MRSSTSNSDARPLFYSKVLVGLCALLLVAIELASRPMTYYSGTYKRVTQQYNDALTARHSLPSGPPSVLMVGNSFLLDGVDVDRLRQLTSSSLEFYPLFLEGTDYYDWLYGLRRLFRLGARPQFVLVGLGIDGVLDNAVRHEYAPGMLFDALDIVRADSELGLDNTQTTSLLLAHWSTFWNVRNVIRTQIMTRVLPKFRDFYLADLWSGLKDKRVVPFDAEHEAIAVARLQRLRHLGERYGARMIILVPPTPALPGAVEQLQSVARKAGVDTLMPIDPTMLPAGVLRPDELHLNEDGAVIFTSALGTELPKKLRNLDSLASEDNISTERRHALRF